MRKSAIFANLGKVKAVVGVAGIVAVFGTALFPPDSAQQLLHLDPTLARSVSTVTSIVLAVVAGGLFAKFSSLNEDDRPKKAMPLTREGR